MPQTPDRPSTIHSLAGQVREVFSAMIRTADTAQRGGADDFYRPPRFPPLPLSRAVLHALWLAFVVGLLRGRCVRWLFSGISQVPDAHPAPPLAARTRAAFKTVYVLRKLGCPLALVGPLHQRLCESAGRELADTARAGPQHLDMLEADSSNEQEIARFLRRHIETFTPCIVRGLARRSYAVRNWSVDWFTEHYGDTLVPLSEPGAERRPQPLRRVRQDGLYIQNCDSIFAANPELMEHLETERLARLAQPLMFVFPHLFLGRAGTGSPFHSAPVWNVFVQIEGRKRWTWVHPGNHIFMYPQIVPLLYGPIVSHVRDASAEDLARCPLFEYCPRYVATLEPGDVMLNPPWWWHRIENLDQTSCGVATRWVEDGGIESTVCGHIDPGIQTLHSWEAAMGMATLIVTAQLTTGLGMVRPDEGDLTFIEAVTRYHRADQERYLL